MPGDEVSTRRNLPESIPNDDVLLGIRYRMGRGWPRSISVDHARLVNGYRIGATLPVRLGILAGFCHSASENEPA